MRSMDLRRHRRPGSTRGALPAPPRSWLLLCAAALGITAAPCRGQGTAELDSLVGRTQSAFRSGDYDAAARNSKALIAQAGDLATYLGRGYLLLIKTYTMGGNFYKNEPNGRETSQLYYREARRCVEECLHADALRHLKPEPLIDYPPEMVRMFTEARAELFGSFRVLRIDPGDAVALLDGDTLRSAGADSSLEERDIPIGEHRVEIRRDGYRDLVEDIRITAGAVTERVYTLRPRRGLLWYASRAAVPLGGVAAAIIVANRRTPPPPPYHEPPGAPSVQ